MPLRGAGTVMAKRKALSLLTPHPGHEKMFCLRAGKFKMIRCDDELRKGDGFGGHGGLAVWQERRAEPNFVEMKLHIVVEGPPCSGKSTLVRNLTEVCRTRGYPSRLFLETPEQWRDETGSNLLDKSASNPHAYSLHLQAMILCRQAKMLAERGGFLGLVFQDR